MMIGMSLAVILGVALATVSETCASLTLTGEEPLVIAHRGASGDRPEHTIAAYKLAIEQGADVIEPDLVMTKDGVLIARHDRYLSTTTDVASRADFADRKRRQFDGAGFRNDWWAEDFTLAEIKSLRAVQPREGRSDAYDGQFEIPTFAEVIALTKATGITIYPETKAPKALARAGLDMETALMGALTEAGWTTASAPVFIQSFEPDILRSLNEKIDVPVVQLVTALPAPGQARPNISLETMAEYADGVGPNKILLVDGKGQTTDFVEDAHAHGLFVHPWTVRDDQPPVDGAEVTRELERLYAAGVDGLFTDHPATAVAVRDTFCDEL